MGGMSLQAGEKNFEAALNRLEEVVKQLEDGELSLEQALTLFGEGVELANTCNRLLSEAEQRINMLATNKDGDVVIKEVEMEYNVGGQD